MIVMYGLAGSEDIADKTRQSEICHQMNQLFINTNGELGWPVEVCK